MKIHEIDLIGKQTPRFKELVKKHNVSSSELLKQLAQGIWVELEHTSSPAEAREIALDHLAEFPDYYSRLQKAETP